MTRPLLALCCLAASATCGPRPTGGLPMNAPALDGGSEDGGASADGGVLTGGLDCRPCDAWLPIELMGPIPMDLQELSGLSASAAMPGVFYAHNDSGDSARIFAFGETGQLLAELKLPGAGAIDWEDMALGPCEGGGSCLFLGDIGDNLRRRSTYVVYRAREPNLMQVVTGSTMPPVNLDLTFDRLAFSYPNGEAHNAEALLSHPRTGDLYVVTKETVGSKSRVYRFPRPFTPNDTVTLVEVGPASVPAQGDSLVTAADISPCGDSLLVRMYNRNVELRAAPDAGFESAFRAEPIEVPTAVDEPQGEAITWGSNAQSFFTASEMSGQLLHRVRCARQ